MKEFKELYFADKTSALTPDSDYHKFYPKTDGWYWMGDDGGEHRVSAIEVNSITGVDVITFGSAFSVSQVGNAIEVDLDWADDSEDLPVHDNTAHTEEYITEDDLIAYNATNVDSLLHTRNADTKLDNGGVNEVTAAQLRALVDANLNVAARGLLYTSDPETNAVRETEYYIADCQADSVVFILPEGDTVEDLPFLFRHTCGSYAMTVFRSELDEIIYGCDTWEGLTTDTEGTWFEIVYSGGYWHVTKDSGVIEGTFAPTDDDES